MVRCPNCGSTAQIKLIDTKYNEDGWTIEVVRTYHCGCGETFTAKSWYHSDSTEELDETGLIFVEFLDEEGWHLCCMPPAKALVCQMELGGDKFHFVDLSAIEFK